MRCPVPGTESTWLPNSDAVVVETEFLKGELQLTVLRLDVGIQASKQHRLGGLDLKQGLHWHILNCIDTGERTALTESLISLEGLHWRILNWSDTTLAERAWFPASAPLVHP